MTDTTEMPISASHPAPGGLTGMNVAELKSVAGQLGISGTGRMRKDQLVAAITARGSGQPAPGGAAATGAGQPRASERVQHNGSVDGQTVDGQSVDGQSVDGQSTVPDAAREDPIDRQQPAAETEHRAGPAAHDERQRGAEAGPLTDGAREADQSPRNEVRQPDDRWQSGQNRHSADRQSSAGRERSEGRDGSDNRQGVDNRQGGTDRQGQQNQYRPNQGARFDDDGDGRAGRRRNRQRSRDRKRGRGPGGVGGELPEQDVQVAEDDVLVPVAGILDVMDSYAFVRTSGYLPGPNDVYVPLGMVKRFGLRKGDAVTGAVQALREGETPVGASGNRAKFNALVRLDGVNGASPEQARTRVEFNKLTPLYPQERLRLETTPNILTTRIIDLVSPIGKGQRGLIVSPPKAGKTLILQAIANAITTNNPEVHLMVVLVDERPEEVTDMQRTVKGEVIASTFDRPADDHTTVAELAIERAKRLVELGHDVVVLLDSITRLGRAYNLAAPASGRILSGGVDSSALYPPKRFFGAARNIEHGGSLTILATALVETGSKMDEVIFEEFKGTGNMELRLSRQLADRRIFPAVDVNPSGTRREEILMGADELRVMWKLRRVLSALDFQQSIELLIDRLKKSKSNVEFLVQVQRTSSIKLDDDDED